MIQYDKDNFYYFIRKEDVNIAKYIPWFIQHDSTINKVAYGHSKEHERLKGELENLLNQFFVSTATWGLDLWERELNLNHKEGDSLEKRRRKIWLKLQSHNTSTVEYMTNLINRYIEDKSGIVEEHNKDYYVNFKMHDNQVTDWAELLEAIKTWLPAHIGYNFITYLKLSTSYFFGGVVSTSEKIYIGQDKQQLVYTYDYPAKLVFYGTVSTAYKNYIKE